MTDANSPSTIKEIMDEYDRAVHGSDEERAAATERGAHEELQRWSQLADTYSERLRGAEAEYERVRLENESLVAHNAQLRQYAEGAHEARAAAASALHEVKTTRARNEQLEEHNKALITHAEKLGAQLAVALSEGPPLVKPAPTSALEEPERVESISE